MNINLHGERRLTLLSLFFLLALGIVYYFRPRPAFVHQFEVAYFNSYWNRTNAQVTNATGVDPNFQPQVGLVTPRYISTLIDTELWLTVTNTSKEQVICPTFVIADTTTAHLMRNGRTISLDDAQVMLRSGEMRDSLSTDGRTAISFGPLQPQESANQLLWVRLLPLGGNSGNANAPRILTGEAITGTVDFAVYLLNPLTCGADAVAVPEEALSLNEPEQTIINMGYTISRGFVRTLLLPPWANGLIIGLALLWAFLANAVVSIIEERTHERLKEKKRPAADARTNGWHLFFWMIVVFLGATLTIFLGDVLIWRTLDRSYQVRWSYLACAAVCFMLAALALLPAYNGRDQTDGSYHDHLKRFLDRRRVALTILIGVALLPALAGLLEWLACRTTGCAVPYHFLFYTVVGILGVIYLPRWIFDQPQPPNEPLVGDPALEDLQRRLTRVEDELLPLLISRPDAEARPVAETTLNEETQENLIDPHKHEFIANRLKTIAERLDGLATRPLTQWTNRLPQDKQIQTLQDEIEKLPELYRTSLAEDLDELEERVKQARALVRPDKVLDRARENAADFARVVSASTDDANVPTQQALHYYSEWRKALLNKRDKYKFDYEPAASRYLALLMEVDDVEARFRRLYCLVPLPADNADELVVAHGRLCAIRDDEKSGSHQTVRFLAHADAPADQFRVVPVTYAIDTAIGRLWTRWLAQIEQVRQGIFTIKEKGAKVPNRKERLDLLPGLLALEPFINGLPGWSSVYNGAANDLPKERMAELDRRREELRDDFDTTRADLERPDPK